MPPSRAKVNPNGARPFRSTRCRPNTPNPQTNTSHNHSTTLEGGATTVRDIVGCVSLLSSRSHAVPPLRQSTRLYIVGRLCSLSEGFIPTAHISVSSYRSAGLFWAGLGAHEPGPCPFRSTRCRPWPSGPSRGGRGPRSRGACWRTGRLRRPPQSTTSAGCRFRTACLERALALGPRYAIPWCAALPRVNPRLTMVFRPQKVSEFTTKRRKSPLARSYFNVPRQGLSLGFDTIVPEPIWYGV